MKCDLIKKISYFNILEFASGSEIKKLNRVNSYFNKFKYKTDIENYAKNDYWATRKEFIFKGAGDCEDYAIAIYTTLLELGIDKKNISLYFSRYKKKFHLVILYKKNNVSYALDNTNYRILPISKRPNLKILYEVSQS
ncbi:transglutaminase-like cysteine peptidase [Poseidonibacter ostreae]|uniref:Transglutaminase-like domain-containing protein n=1 Tax=Poseidonibacter ostreae TaxID=2654171 RepID=A0A6L4WQ67_9BACT|nr:transglutaminase-like cysteine peptidase [Poseidonibacter ostreae]KAB7883030.1 hypothetical protein GA417_13330 [Poseidonibacter ostreae]KAB7884917.1 hypothetical protein GBG19_15125 [Poseidonibacter ostreae]KAB7887399.1 hypothetical protein GBG18_14020 [Poseidonibacter ostreae]